MSDDPAQRDMAARMDALDRLHRPLAHDLRGALNGMVLRLDVLRSQVAAGEDEASAERAARSVDSLVRQLGTLRRNLEGLLSVLRPPVDPPAEFDLGEALADVLAVAAPLARVERVELRPPAPAPVLRVVDQPQRLRQALLEVLLQAIEARPASIGVDVEAAGDAALIRVSGRNADAGERTIGELRVPLAGRLLD